MVPEEVTRRLFARVHDRGAPPEVDLAAVRGLSKVATAALRKLGARAGRLEVIARHRSKVDGFVKYLFRLSDGQVVEAVAIPLPAGPDSVPEKYTLCISSQVGCALACAFCATGRLGFSRHLETWEIVDQVARIRDELDVPVRGLVFMGMGEPFLNYDAVLRAARIFCDPAGFAIGAKAITISTAGIVPAIRRYTSEGHKFRLAISLTSAIEEKRRRLMPIERKYPLDELLDAARAHSLATRDRIMLEYVAISGENVGAKDAAALIERLAGMRVRLNLIDVNDATGRFAPPTEAELAHFRDLLAPLGQPIVRRYSGGREVHGACGMLAGTSLPIVA
ncbi:MAG: radical SAM protein [Myxococcales bacterium]|nr:radical SAM protein [Myxococcales bacterium]